MHAVPLPRQARKCLKNLISAMSILAVPFVVWMEALNQTEKRRDVDSRQESKK